MLRNSIKHGKFSLNELVTTDLTEAKKFYGGLLGWTFIETKNIDGNPYLVIHKESTFIGGVSLQEGNVSDVAPLYRDLYITVDDVKESAEKAIKLGGKIVLPPTHIPKIGHFCVIKDPQGISCNLIAFENKI